MLKQILRQPVLHFFVIGLAFFGLFALTNDPVPEVDQPSIIVSEQDAAWIVGQFEATWRRPPTEDELAGLIDSFVREDIYVREALALGLDQGDAVVRRRLRQKMEFLTEASAEAANPSVDVLMAYHAEHQDKYMVEPRISFSQILIEEGDAGTVASVLADLAAGASPDALGKSTLLPPSFPPSVPQIVDRTFGTGFFEQVSELEEGTWSGPVISGYGPHVVRLEKMEAEVLQPFEAVRDQVEIDWRAEQVAQLREQRFEALREQYTIESPDPAAVLSQ